MLTASILVICAVILSLAAYSFYGTVKVLGNLLGVAIKGLTGNSFRR
jgi:hypothetical protein